MSLTSIDYGRRLDGRDFVEGLQVRFYRLHDRGVKVFTHVPAYVEGTDNFLCCEALSFTTALAAYQRQGLAHAAGLAPEAYDLVTVAIGGRIFHGYTTQLAGMCELGPESALEVVARLQAELATIDISRTQDDLELEGVAVGPGRCMGGDLWGENIGFVGGTPVAVDFGYHCLRNR